jgi:GTPase SAR1 family protein
METAESKTEEEQSSTQSVLSHGYDYVFKVLIIGNNGVGKSSLLLQRVGIAFVLYFR